MNNGTGTASLCKQLQLLGYFITLKLFPDPIEPGFIGYSIESQSSIYLCLYFFTLPPRTRSFGEPTHVMVLV